MPGEKFRYLGYEPLDKNEPIAFDGEHVEFNGVTYTLDENTVFLDYRLDREQITANPYAFNNIIDASGMLKSGTREKPMTILTAPGVYWADDPDDPAERGGGEVPPVALHITCDYLYFFGLTSEKRNVVFAVNRGNTQGAIGNFTMFSVEGKGLKSENVTFGNYCNCDLEYPLVPSLSREKRSGAHNHARLFEYTDGFGAFQTDGVAINTAFIGRQNICLFPSLCINCEIEAATSASHICVNYIGCLIKLYGNSFSPSRFFNCEIRLKPSRPHFEGKNIFYFSIAHTYRTSCVCVDTRFYRGEKLKSSGLQALISWDRRPNSPAARGYMSNVTMDDGPMRIQEHSVPGGSIQLDKFKLIEAYKKVENGKVLYFRQFPSQMPYDAVFQRVLGEGTGPVLSGQTTARFTYGPHPENKKEGLGAWTFKVSNPNMAEVRVISDSVVEVHGTNTTKTAKDVVIVAKNELGIEAAAIVTVMPALAPAPAFTTQPRLSPPENGRIVLDYNLDLTEELTDESKIKWYRCENAQGSNPLCVSVSRLNKPETFYTLNEGDEGAYFKAEISPKHNLSSVGETVTVISDYAVKASDVTVFEIDTDFRNVPDEHVQKNHYGVWRFDGYLARECMHNPANDPTAPPHYTPFCESWIYSGGFAGTGSDGWFGMNQSTRGARMFYTPKGDKPGNMYVMAKFAPGKTLGQGFGAATAQFMDVFIKFDVTTMTGYGLRIQRLSPNEVEALGYDPAGASLACAFSLVEYKNKIAAHITKRVMSSVFRTECSAELTFKNGKLTADITNSADPGHAQVFGYPKEVHLSANVYQNPFCGTGLLHTGTARANSVAVTGWKTIWTP